jgi:ABC-type branched-subunit amino acid transport system permease subunit
MSGPTERRRGGGDQIDHWLPILRAFYEAHRSLSIMIGTAIVGAILPIIVLAPPFSGFLPQSVWVDTFAGAGIFVLLALGLNVVVGLAGLLDLGYAAFFAIGAYTYALSASSFTNVHIPFWPMLLVGAFVAATFGVLLGAPTLRLRGDYLAIVTLGFGEIVPVVFTNSDELTNGTNGIAGVDRPSLPGLVFGSSDPWPFYIVILAIIALVLIFLYRLQNSRLGRAWMAIREDELAAASSGVNTVTTKLLAFALGASTAGFAGVFSAGRLVFVSPDQFGFTVSFTILAMLVLGGMGNMWGVAVGAFTLFIVQSVFLKQLTNFIHPLGLPIISNIDFVQYQFLLYGIALVVMMLLRPEGFFPNVRRRRELHQAQASEGSPEGIDAAGALQ